MTLRDGIKKMRASDTEGASEHVQEGEVRGMSTAYDDDTMCHVDVELPNAPKAGKGDNEKGDAVPAVTRSITAKIPTKHSGRFAIGDKVRVTTRLEKVTKGAD